MNGPIDPQISLEAQALPASKPAVGRPRRSLEIYKLQISAWIKEGVPHVEILRRLNEHVSLSSSTYYHRLRAWNLHKNSRLRSSGSRAGELAHIKARIGEMVFQPTAPPDKEILRVLAEEGFNVAPRTLLRIRRDMGILRRTQTPETKNQADNEVRSFLERELASGNLQPCGKRALKRYFQSHGQMASRDRIFQEYKMLRPDEVEGRRRGKKKTTGDEAVDPSLMSGQLLAPPL